MGIVSVCGRFDNAPAHIIIESTLHRRGAPDVSVPVQRRGPAKPEALKDREFIEKLAKAAAKAAIREAREAREREMKLAFMRRKEAAAKRVKAADWIPGETKDQRKARRARVKRLAAEALQIAALPPGYAIVRDMTLPVCLDVTYLYLRRGIVAGAKVGPVWYADRNEILAALAAAQERHMESLRHNNLGRKRKK